MLDFLHRLLRGIIWRDSLLEEIDWDTLLGFKFTDVQLLSISKFMEKTEFRTKRMTAAKNRNIVEQKKNKKTKTDTIASAVKGDMFNPRVNQRRAYIRCVRKELLKTPNIWVKSSQKVGFFPLFCPGVKQLIATPNYLSIFVLVGGWQKCLRVFKKTTISKLLMTCDLYIRMSCTLARRFGIWSHSCHPVRNWPREKISHLFPNCCLCLGHMLPELPKASLSSPDESAMVIGLSDVIEFSQSCLLGSNSNQTNFTSAASVSSCVELMTEFGGKALQPGSHLSLSVDFQDYSLIQADLTNAHIKFTFFQGLNQKPKLLRLRRVHRSCCHSESSQHRDYVMTWARLKRLLLRKIWLQNFVRLIPVKVAIVLYFNCIYYFWMLFYFGFLLMFSIQMPPKWGKKENKVCAGEKRREFGEWNATLKGLEETLAHINIYISLSS